MRDFIYDSVRGLRRFWTAALLIGSACSVVAGRPINSDVRLREQVHRTRLLGKRRARVPGSQEHDADARRNGGQASQQATDARKRRKL